MSDSPEIRFEGYTDPWEQRKFASVFDGLQNNTLSRADLNYESGTVKNVHYGDVLIKFGDYIDVSGTVLPYISDSSKVEKFRSSFLKDGDIVIADTAEDDTVGKCTEIQGSEGMQLLSGLHTIACRPKEKYGPKFLGYYINSPAYHTQLKPLMQGIKVTSISKSALQETDMLVPKSIDEQTKIGEYFSNLDNLITLHQRKHDKLLNIKKAMLKKMFPQEGANVPEIRFKGFTDTWEQRKLGESLSFLKDGTHGTHTDAVDGPLLLSAKNIKNGTIKWDDTDRRISIDEYKKIHSKFSLQDGDVLLTIVGSIGETAILRAPEGLTFQRSVAFLRPSDDITSEFLYTEIQTTSFQKELENRKSTSAQPGIYLGDLAEIPFSFPAQKDEQERIGTFFANLDNTITLHQRKHEKLINIKKAMLEKMFI